MATGTMSSHSRGEAAEKDRNDKEGQRTWTSLQIDRERHVTNVSTPLGLVL